MADGIRSRAGADLGVGSPALPARAAARPKSRSGTVAVALATAAGTTRARSASSGERQSVKFQASQARSTWCAVTARRRLRPVRARH
jgi:nicotinamide mononucleotide (NMN) deamidase PncC